MFESLIDQKSAIEERLEEIKHLKAISATHVTITQQLVLGRAATIFLSALIEGSLKEICKAYTADVNAFLHFESPKRILSLWGNYFSKDESKIYSLLSRHKLKIDFSEAYSGLINKNPSEEQLKKTLMFLDLDEGYFFNFLNINDLSTCFSSSESELLELENNLDAEIELLSDSQFVSNFITLRTPEERNTEHKQLWINFLTEISTKRSLIAHGNIDEQGYSLGDCINKSKIASIFLKSILLCSVITLSSHYLKCSATQATT